MCKTIGDQLTFADATQCQRCVYARFDDPSTVASNGSLQLYPVDCSTVEIPVQTYICQKGFFFFSSQFIISLI